MSKEYVMSAIKDIEELAREMGLDFYPTVYEFVDNTIMLEACSYGLPVRSRHWSYGRSYDHQKIWGELGMSKVYEIVFNNDPAYAFLLETNSDIINIMVGAHVMGHVDFFKRNAMFQGSDRSMIYRAAERASRVDTYIEKYGLDRVEHLMDIGFALERHIDWHKGVFRKRYKDIKKQLHKRQKDEFADLLGAPSVPKPKERKASKKFPPHPEKDLLWFLAQYAPLEPWEKDVLSIMREEAYYFYPIIRTKILNEGYASFWHAELMLNYNKLNEKEYFEFAKIHSGVVSPGNPFSINPYYLGFKVLTDVRERWDKMHEDGESEINGIQKIIQIATEEDDASFLRNYLTKDLARDLGLFNFGYKLDRKPDQKKKDLTEEHGIIEIKDRELDRIIDNLTSPTIGYGVPLITIDEVDGETLVMTHRDSKGSLDKRYTEKTLGYMYEIWGGAIELETRDSENKATLYVYDERGFNEENIK